MRLIQTTFLNLKNLFPCIKLSILIGTFMRRLAHYIRQIFCKHVFEQKQTIDYVNEKGFVVKETDNYICKKCLYVKRVEIK